jgi:hypothetical protein
VFNCSVLRELGELQLDALTFSHLSQWRNNLATRPKRVRKKRTATEPAARPIADDDDARRKRCATANRVLTQLKAALNRACRSGRIASDAAWRKVTLFKRVDEAVIRYLTTDEAQRPVSACPPELRQVGAGRASDCMSLFRADPLQGQRFQSRRRHIDGSAIQGWQAAPRRLDGRRLRAVCTLDRRPPRRAHLLARRWPAVWPLASATPYR